MCNSKILKDTHLCFLNDSGIITIKLSISIFIVEEKVYNVMMKIESNNQIETVCDLNYLSRLMGGKIHLIKKMMDTFLIQVKEELSSMNNAIIKKDYASIKNLTHIMKSTVSIMGISIALPILQEMEDMGREITFSDSYRDEKLTTLNLKLNEICKKAFVEMENYNFS